MQEKQLEIIIGGLLHDIGKVLYRASDGRNHSDSGYDFLKNEIGISQQEILDQVRCHHAANIRRVSLAEDSPAYITYIADNIASMSDRRKKEDTDQFGFCKDIALDSIFNQLNGHHDHMKYAPKTMDPEEGINYPAQNPGPYSEGFYAKVRKNLKEILRGMEYSVPYVNSLMEVLEAELSFVPSSTAAAEIADISLYDHVKLTAAVGSCIYQYLESRDEHSYKDLLFRHSQEFYDEPAFQLFSMDMSGIQPFIYGQYGNSDVLKNLRARSFYLDLMMENAIDDLLERTELSRANLIYSGGGHAYILLPNTDHVRDEVREFEADWNRWLLDYVKTDLYVAFGMAPCTANEMRNQPEGAYGAIFHRVSDEISKQKVHRYSAEEILRLNHPDAPDGERECRICHRSDRLNQDNVCEVCEGMMRLSGYVLNADFFTITSEPSEQSIPIGKDRYLNRDSEDSLRQRIKRKDPSYIRSYGKNRMFMGKSIASKLWIGDYHSANTLSELAEASTGIERLGVLRTDVDNLGQAFVAGFPEKLQTFSRSATFSRKLSLFFKNYVNSILEHPEFSLRGTPEQRNAAIIYSGGDDMFIVGAWDSVLEFSVDLHHSLEQFTQGSLTASAGFGIYHDKYPISYIASDTGALEDHSKDLKGKNAITLFDQNHRYSWDVFINCVLNEKFRIIRDFFDSSEERGKNFLYNLLDLLRNRDEKINLARFAYVLSRLEPDSDANLDAKEKYRTFASYMYRWMNDDEDSRQAVTAIYIYAYLVRERQRG